MTLLGRRAAWKGPYFKAFNLPKLENASVEGIAAAAGTSKNSKGSTFQMRTTARNCTILPSFVNHTFHVHNGKNYVPVHVTEEMIGHRLGEFSHTRRFTPNQKMKKDQNNRK
ncbi:hypothetical protein MIR68_006875 [Amoeboaphelidium protococcarum]|nr:hypothetical protein MIR68_006875 [Amoeboaphelidium protococcarum]